MSSAGMKYLLLFVETPVDQGRADSVIGFSAAQRGALVERLPQLFV